MASWVGLLPQAPPPTQLENPVDIYTKAANLGDIQAQTRLRQQQAQENVVKLQQQQQAQQDANNFNAHYIQTRNSGGTMKDALDTAHTAGVSAPFIQKLSDADSQMRLRVAQADEANAKVTSQKADQAAGSFLPIKDIADEGQQAAAWAQARAASIAKGAIDPNDPYFPAQYPGVQGLNGAIAHALGAKEYSEYSTKTATEARAARQEAAKAAEDAAKIPGEQAKSQQDELALAAQTAPSLPEAGPVPVKSLYMAPGPAQGLKRPGNIDLRSLAPIDNGDGTWSTVNSTSFQDEKKGSPTFGKEVLVRGILNGQKVDPDDPDVLQQLKDQYYKDGKHLGIFDNGDNADAYAQRLHEDWQNGKIPGVQMQTGQPSTEAHQTAWTDYRNSLPEDIRDKIPEQWSKSAEAQVRRMGLTPQQQTQADQKEDKPQPITEPLLKARAAGAPTGNKTADAITPQQARIALSAGRAPNEATAERQKKDAAIRDAFRDAGYDWSKVAQNVRDGKYDEFASDIADHAEKMNKLPTDVQRKVAAADTTKEQVQAAIDGIREVVKTHPDLIGDALSHPINALKRKGETTFGSEPPDIGAVDSTLETAAALQPGQHNFRSIGALGEFKKALGIDPRTGKADGSRAWLINPDKAINALQAIVDFNDRLKQNTLSVAGRGGGSAVPAATTPAPTISTAPASGNHVDDWKKALGLTK